MYKSIKQCNHKVRFPHPNTKNKNATKCDKVSFKAKEELQKWATRRVDSMQLKLSHLFFLL